MKKECINVKRECASRDEVVKAQAHVFEDEMWLGDKKRDDEILKVLLDTSLYA